MGKKAISRKKAGTRGHHAEDLLHGLFLTTCLKEKKAKAANTNLIPQRDTALTMVVCCTVLVLKYISKSVLYTGRLQISRHQARTCTTNVPQQT